MTSYLIESAREIPILGEYDVVVAGGGPAGTSAAVSAARLGLNVALIERYGYLGGQATGGLVILIVGLTDGTKRIIKGNCQEIISRLEEQKQTEDVGHHVLFDPEAMKHLFDCMLIENGVHPHYHYFVANTVFYKEDSKKKLSALILEGKTGRCAIKSKLFIDATGDADLAKYTDIPYEKEDLHKVMPVTLGFRVGNIDVKKVQEWIRDNRQEYVNIINELGISTKIGGWIKTINKNEAWFNVAHAHNIDITQSEELTKSEIHCRDSIYKLVELFKKRIDGFQEGHLIDTAAQMGVRDSRRIKGVYKFTTDDLESSFEDAICRAPNYAGKHHTSVEVPYRCLISPEISNVIFAGRSISVEHKLLDMFREIPCCIATGQAAGVASALVVAGGNYHEVDTNRLREILISQGVVI